MDFTFSEEQLAVAEAATGVFAGSCDPERVGTSSGPRTASTAMLWEALADADLLGLAVPESEGGGRPGLMELCLAPRGARATRGAGAPVGHPRARGPAHRGLRLRGAARHAGCPAWSSGDVILTAALAGGRRHLVAAGRAGTARRRGVGADGTELAVPQAHLADRIVVPAHTEGGAWCSCCRSRRARGHARARLTTNREVHPHLHLDGVTVGADDVLAGADRVAPGVGMDARWRPHTLCALQVGVCEAAVTQTAAYLNGRHQFGRPLSTFQGTMLRAADAAIDTEAMRVTWQAAWRLDSGRDAGAPPVAKWRRPSVGSGSCTPPSISTGAWVRTSPTRSTATSCGASRSSCCSAAPARSWPGSGAIAERGPGRGGGGEAVTAPPVSTTAPSTTSRWATPSPSWSCPLTRTLIVSAAIASRDYQDVHHDSVLAHERGSKDIFMNILTTNGLVGRYVTDWAGPRGRLSRGQHPARAPPTTPTDTMTLTGSVTAKGARPTTAAGRGRVTVRGANSLGDHVTGTVRVVLPMADESPNGERRRAHTFAGRDGHRRHRGHRVLQGVGAQRAAAGRRGGRRRPPRRRHRARPRSTGW